MPVEQTTKALGKVFRRGAGKIKKAITGGNSWDDKPSDSRRRARFREERCPLCLLAEVDVVCPSAFFAAVPLQIFPPAFARCREESL